jgi:hypothetical protein
MHYEYDWFGKYQIEGAKLYQDQSWAIVRSIYKGYQIITMTVLVVMSFIVFYRVAKALKSDEAYKSIEGKVRIFTWIFLTQLVVREVFFISA